jgi:hypothetical protein
VFKLEWKIFFAYMRKMLSTLVVLLVFAVSFLKTRQPTKHTYVSPDKVEAAPVVRDLVDTVPGCKLEPDWSMPMIVRSKFSHPFSIHLVTYGDPAFEKTMFRLWL